MERKINRKVETYINDFRNDLINKLQKCDISNNEKNKLAEHIRNYQNLQLNKDDFMKRKRMTTVINLDVRCCAKIANGEQCSRKRKDNCELCGTHEKNQPYGIIEKNIQTNKLRKCEIIPQDIKGIYYYIDNDNNVYDHTDIKNNSSNPKIIAKCTIINGEYKLLK